MSQLVFYSLFLSPDDPRPDLLRQLLTSVQTLREHNGSVDVAVFVHGELPAELEAALAPYGVHFHRQEPYEARLARLCPRGWPVLRLYPILHKFFNFSQIAALAPRQALFLDCDTIFFGDVGRLFARYGDAHLYAREEPTCARSPYGYDPRYLDEEALARLAWSVGVRSPPPMNLGAVLFNHGAWNALAGLEETMVSYAWRLMTWLALHPDPERTNGYGELHPVRLLRRHLHELATEDDLRSALPYPSGNEWIVEQVAVWLALGHVPGLVCGDFSPREVLQNGEILSHPAPEPEWILCHYFTQNMTRLEEWLHASALAVHP